MTDTDTDAFFLTSDRLPTLLTRSEVAKLARCCVRTVQRAECSGLLRAVRRGGVGSTKTLYARGDVLRWLGIEQGAHERELRAMGVA
ncbi:MAG: helix-turn-helix domain-containing protein [Planctomycetes bacterium]|nr:helix-turn-helix domain-containing protein [Planctomycetota bacterium]